MVERCSRHLGCKKQRKIGESGKCDQRGGYQALFPVPYDVENSMRLRLIKVLALAILTKTPALHANWLPFLKVKSFFLASVVLLLFVGVFFFFFYP